MFTFLLIKLKGKEYVIFLYGSIIYLFLTITMFGFFKGFISYLVIFLVLKVYASFKVKVNNRFDTYFGVPGSGKSTFATAMAIQYLKKGLKVYANFDISGAELITKEEIRDDNPKLKNCLLIIDEAGLDYDNRNYKNNFSPAALKLFKYHRHKNIDVMLFSQDYEDMDKKLRKLSTRLFVLKKSSIPFFIKRNIIAKSIDIDKDTHQIIDRYSFVLFSGYYVFMPKTWKYFDSFTDK